MTMGHFHNFHTVYAYKSLRVEKVQFEVILLMPVNEKQYLRFFFKAFDL